jgi:hypothetical protein
MLFWGIERGWEEWPLEGRRKGGASLNYSSKLLEDLFSNNLNLII